MAYHYIEGMERPLPDYAERLARRTGTKPEELQARLEAGKMTAEEALKLTEGV
jgi:tape measure domain-containing protein